MDTIHQWQPGDGDEIMPACEQQLVADAQAGCVDSFTQLVNQYEGRVVRYLTRRTGDRELAADLAQQTFFDAFRHLDRLRDDRPFPAWLFRIAQYNLLHECRRQRSRQAVSLERLLDQAGTGDHALQRGDHTARSHEWHAIQHALGQLSRTVREPLLLHALYGFTSQEIADMLGIAAPAVRQRVVRAKAQFRRVYDVVQSGQQDRYGTIA